MISRHYFKRIDEEMEDEKMCRIRQEPTQKIQYNRVFTTATYVVLYGPPSVREGNWMDL